ncbi:hypothetical protein AKJ09_04639 [Labilithrix luteola]|uniref:Uncharacterized protein n=1 Tax=Labilithrix luteola TaxID=1391654 RepID=A0A0K1PWR4_9BACT|nr:hypothetical protein AKJ09_04639 [Labilithrix luteola]
MSATLASEAKAVDLPQVGGAPVRLEVTETSIAAQRFNARDGENERDQGSFSWLNRLNVVLSWKQFTFGARLDSSLYALRPEDRNYADPSIKDGAIADGASRYRDSLYPAKLYLTYKNGIVEATAGDSYVQFGRGLVLSMRKVDELGIDTTLFGGKLTLQKDPFSFTVTAGLANPARVDEPTGRALFLPKPIPGREPQPLFGSDRIIAAQIQAGRGLPVVASTQAAMLDRCAPYRYNRDGSVQTGLFDAPFGTCDEGATDKWSESWSKTNPVSEAKRTINASQSIEVPNLWGHGNFYVEAAVQKRELADGRDNNTQGNAVYASLTNTGGPITNTLEVKSYRNFLPLAGSINISQASAFSNIAYSAPPTAEVVTQDSMFGFFNACVTGGRDRLDYRVNNNALFWGALGYFVTRSEVGAPPSCDKTGKSTATNPSEATNSVIDVSAGTQLQWDDDKSIAFLTATYRNDTKDNGDLYYREYAFQYSITKYISGPYALEIAGRHRRRQEEGQNARGANSLEGQPWSEGDNQVALKVAPKWIFSQGFEYTTFIGLPTYYFNGGIVYRFTSQSNIRLFGGQNRGGLRCVSGICRFFPAFSGARVELTLRF